MSLPCLVIAEDPTLDQHILRPVVEKLFEDLGHRARVDVYEPPRGAPRGVAQAIDPATLAAIVADYHWIRVFMLVVDRDCLEGRVTAVASLCSQYENLVACLAVEEVETWMLALHREAIGHPWSEVRAECHPKERFAVPFLRARGWTTELGKGRRRAMRALRGQWAGLLQVCPEIAQLKNDLSTFLTHSE